MPRCIYVMRSAIALLSGVMVISVCGSESLSAVTGFVETFSGQGKYESVGGQFTGLDNPGWDIDGNGEITDQGYVFSNITDELGPSESDRLIRSLEGMGSFRERIVVRNLDLGEIEQVLLGEGAGVLSIIHNIGGGLNDRITLSVRENSDTNDNVWTLRARAGTEQVFADVPRGPNAAFEIVYDDVRRTALMSYDVNIDDNLPAMSFGPLDYSAVFPADEHFSQVSVGASSGGKADGILEWWSLLPLSGIHGDFNGNALLDAADIDLLSAGLRAGTTDMLYDLNADAVVDDLDRQFWVRDLKQTYFGDADLNGAFSSADLVQVLASGEYEDGVELNSTWLTGDWDGDADFSSGDLVVALADGGYEAGAATLPEPAGGMLVIVAAALAAMTQRPKTRRE